ncbi:odorant receptor 67c [Drosophila guanche]|uniref:Odorant receptor n=1 Tax=Drosophila guanche TaxID=7266 RepID=A0A3B0J8P2_DROGU|nr:odorant receptor 67c [Drosophila guanche]SPP76673.1 blast:Odorant receptor 67c [Drosophila guanche]
MEKFNEKVTSQEQEMDTARTFEDMMWVPVQFYRSIGEDIYAHRSKRPLWSLLLKIYLYAGFINFNLLVIGELVFFYNSIQDFETIRLAIAVAPCIGFSLVADFKQFAMVHYKATLIRLLDELEEMHPKTLAMQRAYRMPDFERTMKRVINIFTFLCLAYTTTFSFYPALKASVKFNFLGYETFDRNFGFLIWFPFDATSSNWVYWIVYWDIAHGAYLAGIAFLCADLLLIVVITQICMHFNYISMRLEEHPCKPHKDKENIEFLVWIIRYHDKCLTLCEHVNSLYSFSLLLNFLMASMQICFIAFQVTESTVEVIIIYCIFLMTSMVQVFLVCYYGDTLIATSLRVGDSAYNQKWFQCSKTYCQMLKMLIMRSQKPASIRPPTFPPISLVTYMKVISMSYQFFALLRTTYSAN